MQGSENSACDALLRVKAFSIQTVTVDFQALAQGQHHDPDLLAELQKQSSLELKDITLTLESSKITCDVSTATPLPFVHLSFQKAVYEALHYARPSGIHSTKGLVTACYVWPSINSDLRRRTKTVSSVSVAMSPVLLSPSLFTSSPRRQDLTTFT